MHYRCTKHNDARRDEKDRRQKIVHHLNAFDRFADCAQPLNKPYIANSAAVMALPIAEPA